MRRLALAGVAVLVIAGVALAVAALRASRPLFDETLDPAALEALEIADPDRALTFARQRVDGGHRLLLVTGFRDGAFQALDLNAHFASRAQSPLELLAAHGYDALRNSARTAGATLRVPEHELDVPVAPLGDRHVAAGANFAAHGAEAGIDEPFVFPKRAAPTPWNAPVPVGEARRLDYEVELCFVPLGEIDAAGGRPELGILLCNDFTDRWALVRGMAAGEGEIGTRGFADGKGAPGFLPVGPLLLVPRDLEELHPEIELSLWVNGRLRQRSHAGAMIWDPSEIIDQSFARTDWSFDFEGQGTKLLPEGRITPETLVLSGTPEGVVFRLVNVWWGPAYLHPGDRVDARATWLGRLQNEIVR